MSNLLSWRPVAVGQLVAASTTCHDEGSELLFRVTFKYGESRWIGYFEGGVIASGDLQTVLGACESANQSPQQPYDPWADVLEVANLLRQPNPNIDSIIGLLSGALDHVQYTRNAEKLP